MYFTFSGDSIIVRDWREPDLNMRPKAAASDAYVVLREVCPAAATPTTGLANNNQIVPNCTYVRYRFLSRKVMIRFTWCILNARISIGISIPIEDENASSMMMSHVE